MATTHETLELGIIPQDDNEILEDNMNKDCKNAEDVCSESTPMNTPAVNGDDPHPVEPEDIHPDSNPTNSLHSEKGNMIFCIDLLYISRCVNNENITHFYI